MAKLYIFTRSGRSEFNLADHNVIGRHPKNRIKILSVDVSKVHCLITGEQGRNFAVRDLGSRNGTFVNGRRIRSKTPLRDGDEIRLGSTRCVFREALFSGVFRMVAESDDVLARRIAAKVSPPQLNRFFPAHNIVDEEMLRNDYERLRIAFELHSDIGFDLHVDYILGRVLDRLFEFLEFDQGVVYLQDESGTLKPQSYKLRQLEHEVVVSAALLRRIAAEGKGLLLQPVEDDPPPGGPEGAAPAASSVLAMPVLDNDVLLGAIVLERWSVLKPFQERDLHLLANAANKTAMFILNSRVAKNVTRESVERDQWRRMFSPEMAEMVVAGQLRADSAGRRYDGSVLVANVVGFEALLAGAEAEERVAFLNDYFDRLVEVVFGAEGLVAHYLGDRLVAAWGVPLAREDHAQQAVRAALRCLQAVETLNAARRKTGRHPFEVGIGVASGLLLAGNVGARQAPRFGILGPPVLRALALADQAAPGEVRATRETYIDVRGFFATDKIADPGGPPVYRILGPKGSSADRPWTYLG
jgi:adenylate cyclase